MARHWRLRVDTSERHAALLDLARGCGDFEICMGRLAVGDYFEGPTHPQMPDVQAHALKGAILSLAVMWRLPVVHARNPEDSLRILRLAGQLARTNSPVLQRYDRKPKRLASRKLHMLQGLPGVGPALANRLLVHLGSVERVITADQELLAQVRGIESKKAQQVRNVVS